MEKEGVAVHLGRQAEVSEYREDGVTVTLDDGTVISAEKLLVSVGRRSQAAGIGLEELGVEITDRGIVVVDDYLRTANPKIWAVGDCIGGLQLAHLASAEGGRAVENALTGHLLPMDRTVVPSCIYTHPEIATVGLNADAAKEAGYEVKLGQARFLGSGKALGEGEPDGYAQVVIDAKHGPPARRDHHGRARRGDDPRDRRRHLGRAHGHGAGRDHPRAPDGQRDGDGRRPAGGRRRPLPLLAETARENPGGGSAPPS